MIKEIERINADTQAKYDEAARMFDQVLGEKSNPNKGQKPFNNEEIVKLREILKTFNQLKINGNLQGAMNYLKKTINELRK